MQGTDELEEIHAEDSQTLPTTEAIATPTFEVGGDEEEVSVDVLDREEVCMFCAYVYMKFTCNYVYCM